MRNTLLHAMIAIIGITSSLYGYNTEYYQSVQKLHATTLSSFTGQALTGFTPIEKLSFAETFKNVFKPGQVLKNPELGAREKFELSTIAQGELSSNTHTTIDLTTVQKLSLIHGDIDTPSQHCMSTLSNDYLFTYFGKNRFVELLCSPITDLQVLAQRQHAIKTLLQNNNLERDIASALTSCKQHEHYVLEFFKPTDQVKQDLESHVFFNWAFLKGLNTNTTVLEVKSRISQLSSFMGGVISPLLLFFTPQLCTPIVRYIYNKKNPGSGDKIPPITWKYLYEQYHNQFVEMGVSPQAATLGIAAYFGGLIAFPTVYGQALTVYSFKNWHSIMNYFHDQTIGVASFIRNARTIHESVKNNDTLSAVCSAEIQACNELFDGTQGLEIQELLEDLDTNTFKGSASIMSFSGRVLSTYKRLCELKEKLAPLFRLVGYVDALHAISKKMSVTTAAQKFCFVEFDTTSTNPVIFGKNVWNPFVAAEKAIGNDIVLGKHNFILTGPNKGGKSTLMKSVALNLILAHTFGIAAADSLQLTPFHLIGVHLNEQDSVSNETSHFQAQAKKAKLILEQVRTLKPQEFGFVLLDEMFSGTTPAQDIKESINFLNLINQYNNCCFIAATHHFELTTLADNNSRFKNMYMGADVNAQGKVIRYTYKLQEGISPVRNAEQVLEDEGISW